MNEYKIIVTPRMFQERFIYDQLMNTLARVLKNLNNLKNGRHLQKIVYFKTTLTDKKEAATRRLCSIEKLLLKISKYPRENTCVGFSF